jgi:hypothetical protein
VHYRPVELISLDHTLDYYDISEGTFNSFSAEDYNKINNDVKEHIGMLLYKVIWYKELKCKVPKH